MLTTIRAYPREQLGKSMAGVLAATAGFGIEDLDPSSWVAEQFDDGAAGERGHYLASRQARNALHIEGFTAFHIWVVRSSLVADCVSAAGLAALSSRLIGLSVVVAFVVFANAFVTGTMSMVDERYGSRVIWMVPFLIGLFVLDWFQHVAGRCKGQR